MTRRSVAVAIAVTIQQLIDGKLEGWSFDQFLVIEALRRTSGTLSGASEAELGAYLRGFSDDQLRGVISNVKGIYHELLVAHQVNAGGEYVSARLFEETNHPGADIEFSVDGIVIGEIQLKAVQDPASILQHFERYPDIPVMTTTEAYASLAGAFGDRVTSSGFDNETLSETTRATLEELAGEDLSSVFQDGIVTSLVVSGALQAKAALSGERIGVREVRSTLELMGIGAGTAFTVDTLLNLV